MAVPAAVPPRPALRGQCPECLTVFALGEPPADVDVTQLACQAVIANLAGVDRPFVRHFAPPMQHIRTEQGLTPVRPCGGVLELL